MFIKKTQSNSLVPDTFLPPLFSRSGEKGDMFYSHLSCIFCGDYRCKICQGRELAGRRAPIPIKIIYSFLEKSLWCEILWINLIRIRSAKPKLDLILSSSCCQAQAVRKPFGVLIIFYPTQISPRRAVVNFETESFLMLPELNSLDARAPLTYLWPFQGWYFSTKVSDSHNNTERCLSDQYCDFSNDSSF